MSIAASVCLPGPLLSAAPAHPRWAIHSYTEKGESWIDQPNCHPLGYFSGAPTRFDYEGSLYGEKPAELTDKAHVDHIGQLGARQVYDVIHSVNDGATVIKMILVQRNIGEFCEIYQQQYDAVSITVEPAYLVPINSETLLATSDASTGNGGQALLDLWAFDKDGPINLNVDAARLEIMHRLLPKDRSVLTGNSMFDIPTLTFAAPVWRPGDPHCCPTGGSIHIQFALRNHHLAAIAEHFDPTPEN